MSENGKFPDVIEPADRFEFLYAAEKQAKIEAQMAAVQGQFAVLQTQSAEAKKSFAETSNRMRLKYGLSAQDEFNKETGAITRAKSAALPEPVAESPVQPS